jgi:hypothetical protein
VPRGSVKPTNPATDLPRVPRASRKPSVHAPSPETSLAALIQQAEALGLDEAGKKKFVETMWKWLLDGDSSEKMAIAAARILGRGFISEKVDVDKPVALKIEGLDAGISRLMGSDNLPELGPQAEDK